MTARLTRDRPTWLVYLQLGVFATYLYGLSAALPMLRAELGLSQTVAGLHGTMMAVGGVLTGLALPRLTRRLGTRVTVWTGLTGMNVGVLLVVLGHTPQVTLLAYCLAGGMGSISLYTSMSVLGRHHGPAGPSAISEANAVGGTIGLFAPFVVSLAAQSALGWRTALLLTPLLTVLLALAMGRVWVPTPAQEEQAAPSGSAGSPGLGMRFHLAGAVLFCCVGLEFSFNLWAAKLVSDNTGLSAAVAASALTAFTAGLALGRFGGARLALRIPPASLLIGALGLTFVGWLLFWTSTAPPAAYAGLLVSGVGVSLHFPLALSRVLTATAGRPERATGVASLYSSSATGVGPFLLGALADVSGTQQAFLMVPVMIVLAVGGILVSSR
ncbi:MFS transporter [Streptosporangium sp. NPDC049376]|uniref:MFS transporter n=1 Tax=Streptosporangium sp. NPDC049376 TaxID=3366192 RepID=UPI0037A4E85D